MKNVSVFVRFRPISSEEEQDDNDSTCISIRNSQTCVFKGEKDEDFTFDRVFHEGAKQADVYKYFAEPIIRGTVNKGVNGSIVVYGQTGAGKTYSMEGPIFSDTLMTDNENRGLLTRVVEGLFEFTTEAVMSFSIQLSMVEIYMEKVRDLIDILRDDLQIKENGGLSGVKTVNVENPTSALEIVYAGMDNKQTRPFAYEAGVYAPSGSTHVAYIFSVKEKSEATNRWKRKIRKFIVVELAATDKIALGDKSLSALSDVIFEVQQGKKVKEISYNKSKLTGILKETLNVQCNNALMCCCSMSTASASETKATLNYSLCAAATEFSRKRSGSPLGRYEAGRRTSSGGASSSTRGSSGSGNIEKPT